MNKKRQHHYYADDEENAILKAYARANGRSVSELLVHCALTEAKRHTPVEELTTLVRQLIHEEIEKRLPAPGKANEG